MEFPFVYPGIRQLYELRVYKVVQQVDPNPLVLDADDLLENPKEMMQLYCSSTGLRTFHRRHAHMGARRDRGMEAWLKI